MSIIPFGLWIEKQLVILDRNSLYQLPIQVFELGSNFWFCVHDLQRKPFSLFSHICIFPEQGSFAGWHSLVSESSYNIKNVLNRR